MFLVETHLGWGGTLHRKAGNGQRAWIATLNSKIVPGFLRAQLCRNSRPSPLLRC